jgi:hypothetical protein
MTRDEIRLLGFVLLALAVGAGVQWWVKSDSMQPAAAPVERKRGWPDPPYVFKSRAQMDRLKESLPEARVRP